jgi:hypothetical protein
LLRPGRTQTPPTRWQSPGILAAADDDDNSSSNDESSNPPPTAPKLVLSAEEIQKQLSQLKSKYPTSEADFLAAARARAAAKPASVQRSATDEDWQQIAREKKAQMGELDDWENSAKEAGNADSQILIPLEMQNDGDGEDPDEPKLMLF